MALVGNLTIAFSILGSVLALILMALYVRTFYRIRARFTLTLMVVALFFFAQYTLLAYALLTMMAEFTELVINMLVFTIAFGDVALGLLLFNTLK